MVILWEYLASMKTRSDISVLAVPPITGTVLDNPYLIYWAENMGMNGSNPYLTKGRQAWNAIKFERFEMASI